MSFSFFSTINYAVICGIPTPAIILVVHIDPGYIPTLIPSAPTPINSLVASAVTTLPAIICVSENSFFNLFTASITSTE